MPEVAAQYGVAFDVDVWRPGRAAGESGAGRDVRVPPPRRLPFGTVRRRPAERVGPEIDAQPRAVGADDRCLPGDQVAGIDDDGNLAPQAADLGEDFVLGLESELLKTGAGVEGVTGSDGLARMADEEGMPCALGTWRCYSAAGQFLGGERAKHAE